MSPVLHYIRVIIVDVSVLSTAEEGPIGGSADMPLHNVKQEGVVLEKMAGHVEPATMQSRASRVVIASMLLRSTSCSDAQYSCNMFTPRR